MGCWPQEWRIDGGTEFSIFAKWAKSAPMNMTVTLSAPYAYKQNGVSEFSRFYILQIARTMRIDAGAPQELWPEAVNTAAYIINRLRKPISKHGAQGYRAQGHEFHGAQGYRAQGHEFHGAQGDQLYQQAPIIAWRKSLNIRSPENVSLSFLRVWYAKAYVHIPKEKRVQSQKMEARAWIGHLVRYEGDNGHIYRIYDPKTKKVSRHRDVVFQEQKQGIPHYDDRDIIIGGETIDAPPPISQRGIGSPVITANTTRHLTQDLPPLDSRVEEIDEEEDHTLFTTPTQAEKGKGPASGKTPMIGLWTPSLSARTGLWTPSPSARTTSIPSPSERERQDSSSPDPITATPTPWTRTSRRQTAGIPPRRFDEEQWDAHGRALSAIGLATIQEGLKIWQVKIPRNYKEALNSPEKDLWQDAMNNQITKLEAARAYQLVNTPPKGSTILPGKWVYDLKCDKEDYITEMRARWVICGNRQRPGFDFDDTYTPVARPESTRLFLSMVAIRNMEWEQIDYTTAYLNALIDERCIFMRPPIGYYAFRLDQSESSKVCMLKQALYGLRQSANLWYETLKEELKRLGFEELPDERCIFTHRERDLWLLLYIDDTLSAALDKRQIQWFKDNITFKIKVIGELARFLGSSLTRSANGASPERALSTIFIDQCVYLEDLLQTASLGRVSSTYLPIKSSYQPPFSTAVSSSETVSSSEIVSSSEKAAFGEDVSKVAWLGMRTRPDIAFAVNRLQRRTANPRKEDLQALSQLLRYLKGAPDYGIRLADSSKSNGLIGYVDSSFNDCEDGKSTEAYVFYYARAPISWSSRKQDIVATGSTIAEYIALDGAVREGLYLKKILIQLRLLDDTKPTPIPIPICTDSDNAVAILKKDSYNKGTKWLDIKYQFVKHAWKEKQIDIQLIDSKENPADTLTKALPKVDFERIRKLLVSKKEMY